MDKVNPDKSALIIVDMLNDFVEESGTLVVPGAKELVPRQKLILEKWRDSRMPVFFLADNHLKNDPEFDIWPPHAIAGTWGAQVVDELTPIENEKLIPKRRYSGFFGTDLDLSLREFGIEHVVLMGVLTDICVMYTSADASARGLDVTVVNDVTGSLNQTRHEFAIQHMKDVHNSRIIDTDELLTLF